MSEKSVASIKTLARYEPVAVYIGTGYVAECVRADDGDYYLAADADAAIEALQAEIERLREALEEILSRSSINLAMRPDPFALTAELGNIHQIADAALSKENKA